MNPQTIEKLEPITAPLQGINLIEASAGTGKTYTITTLFIRLILEQHLPVDNILVVTFTEAATEELRDRVRRRLREALIAFQQRTSEDEVLAQLMAKCEDHNAAIFRLTNALRGFDEAAIFFSFPNSVWECMPRCSASYNHIGELKNGTFPLSHN